jgi:hypothetical protein
MKGVFEVLHTIEIRRHYLELRVKAMSRPVIEIQGFRELQENKTQTLGIRKRNFTDPEASGKPIQAAKGFITF